MAYIVKHPKSKYYSAVWRDSSGKQMRRSTRTTDRRLAKKLAEEFEAAARNERTARQMREVIVSLHRTITGRELTAPPVRDYFTAWLDRKRLETAPATLTFYSAATAKFLLFLGEDAGKGIDLVTTRQILDFRNHVAKTLTAKTVNHNLKCLKMIFRAARKEGVLHEDPAENVDTIRNRRENSRRPLTVEQIRAVMAVADAEWKSLIHFGLYAGMRLGDCARLTWENVDVARREVRYRAAKTGRTIILPLAGPLETFVKTLPAPSKRNQPLHPAAFDVMERNGKSALLSSRFAVLLSKAGLREKPSHAAKEAGQGPKEVNALSFHSLRHSAVTMMKEAGVPAAVVMAIAGHSSEQMSQHYTSIGTEALMDAGERMPSIL